MGNVFFEENQESLLQNYPRTIDESHTIQFEEEEQVHLEFTDFALESQSQ